MFIDCSIRQKNKAAEEGDVHYLSNFVFMPEYNKDNENPENEHLHLIVISGLNSEAQNIIFGVAFVQEINYETFCWVLFHLKQANTSILTSATLP